MDGRGNDWLHNGFRIFFWDDEVLKLERDAGCTTLWMPLNATDLCALKLFIVWFVNFISIKLLIKTKTNNENKKD